MTRPSEHAKQSSRLNKKLKRQRRGSELGKLPNVLKRRPQPTRNDGTKRELRGRRRERGRNKRGSWLFKVKKIGNCNRAC